MSKLTEVLVGETLRRLTIDEYGNEMTFRKNVGGSTSVSVSVTDPAREERRRLRTVLTDDLADDYTIADVLTWLDERDSESMTKWGEPEPSKHAVSFYFDPELSRAVGNLLGEDDIDFETRKTIESVKETA